LGVDTGKLTCLPCQVLSEGGLEWRGAWPAEWP
jgi:hypothetical protein